MPARRLLSTCYFLPSACARLGPTRGVNFQKVAKSPIKSARKIELFLYPESSRADTIALEPFVPDTSPGHSEAVPSSVVMERELISLVRVAHVRDAGGLATTNAGRRQFAGRGRPHRRHCVERVVWKLW